MSNENPFLRTSLTAAEMLEKFGVDVSKLEFVDPASYLKQLKADEAGEPPLGPANPTEPG
jgi:hypothetical protein